MTVRRAPALLAAAALLAGCIDAPPDDPVVVPGRDAPEEGGAAALSDPPEDERPERDRSPDATPPPEPRHASSPLRAETAERAARTLAVRVRAVGCGQLGTGSGFAVDPGLLVTNRHVVEYADRIQVSTWDGRSIDAASIAVAHLHDLALVAVDAELPAAALAAADPRPGDPVTVVGYPRGQEQDLAAAVVLDSVDAAEVGDGDNTGPVLRLDAEIAPGSSGGPVLDADGNVAGVVYAIEQGSGAALALPVSALRRFLDTGGVAHANTC